MNYGKDANKYILGETEGEFICTTEEENQQFTVAMIKQTELHLDILSHNFDPNIYDNNECYEAIEDLALRSRHSCIRILLHNISFISQRGHSIIHLGKRLGSLMQFRSVATTYRHIADTFMIVDGIGVIHRLCRQGYWWRLVLCGMW